MISWKSKPAAVIPDNVANLIEAPLLFFRITDSPFGLILSNILEESYDNTLMVGQNLKDMAVGGFLALVYDLFRRWIAGGNDNLYIVDIMANVRVRSRWTNAEIIFRAL